MERGRPERPLDEAPGPVRDLAAALRALRAAAGNPSYRTMATTAHFSPATLARAAAGHRLPSLDVVIAYATACGADREEWERRWRACTEAMAQASAEIPALSAVPDYHLPDHDPPDHRAENGQPPQVSLPRLAGPIESPSRGSGGRSPGGTARSGPPRGVRGVAPPGGTGPAPARRRPHTRQGTLALASLTVAATVLLGIGAIADSPAQDLAGASTARSDPAVGEPLGRTCAPTGVIARMPPHARSARDQAARVRQSFEAAAFVPTRDGWSWWWNKENLVEDLTTSTAYDGRQSLRVQVPSGETGIGTIHITGLAPGDTVTVHIWYGGQGEGHICPFVQNKKATIEWIPQEDLSLTPSDWPGWRTYTWTVPAFALIGTGFELVNTGASDFVILLDAVTW